MNLSILRNLFRGRLTDGITAGIGVVAFVLWTYPLIAQGGFETVEILENTSYQFTVQTANTPTITNPPDNGNLVRTHLGGNTFRFTYTPNTDFNGLDFYSIEIYSGSPPFWDISYLNHTVEVRPSIVIARDDALELPHDTSNVQFAPLNNDSSSAGDLTLKGISLSDGVDVSVSSDFTTLTINPNPGFIGLAYIQYVAKDSVGSTDQAMISILFTDPNEQLVDHFDLQTPENTSVDGQLSSSGYTKVENPDYGYVELDSTGRFTYYPAQGYTGQDSFAFEKGDHLRTVSVDVFEVPKPNTFALDDYVYTPVNEAVTFNVLDNDITDNFNISSCNCPQGTIEEGNEKGEYTYTPVNDYEGTLRCTYTVSAFGGSTSETADIYIYVGNLSPEGASPYQLVTTKNQPVVINYTVPLSNFMFSESQSPDHGSLEVYSGLDTLNIGCDQVIGYNLVVYTPAQDYTGMDEFELEYCIDGGNNNCDIVKVEVEILDQSIDSSCVCVDKCVWPGDANDDGMVDMKDLLTTGYHIGISGAERPNPAPGEWYGQYCAEWDEPWENNGANTKYADTDGDGFIEVEDTSGISNFYYNIHSLIPEQERPPLDYPLELVYTGPSDPEIGDYVTFDLVLGSQQYPAQNMDGLTFSFDYDTSAVNDSTLTWTFKEDNWLTQASPSIKMVKKPFAGRVDAGITRISGSEHTGYGVMATVGFEIIDDINGIKSNGSIPINIYVRNSHAMTIKGDLFRLPEIRKTIHVRLPNEEEEDVLQSTDVLVFPNPTDNGYADIRLNGSHVLKNIALYSMNGRLIKNQDFTVSAQRDHYRLHTGALSTGLYIIRITTPRGQVSKKLEVMNW